MTQRNRLNGQYTGKNDHVCRCGARKGEHMAEAPFNLDRTKCEKFKGTGEYRERSSEEG